MRVRTLLGLSLLLAGCALSPPLIDPSLSQRLPSQAEIRDTPFILQEDFQCGPASLAMVMQFYGHDVSTDTLARQAFTPKAEGSFPVEMDVATRRQGFVAYPLDQLTDLLTEIAAGHPVLVLQNLGVSWYPKWHFAVAVGYDLNQRELVLRSGDLARRTEPFRVFDTTWQRSGRWGRVIVPPNRLPATASAVPYLAAASTLEQASPAAAGHAYQLAADTWPHTPLAHFALANWTLTEGQATAALPHYQRLLALAPEQADGWNNYAYGLQQAGCPQQAKAAARCALTLAPDSPTYQDTATELLAQPNDPRHGQCPTVSCPATPTP